MERALDEVYLSTDIEADGPIPGLHSMRSFALAACADKTLPGTYSANFETTSGAQPHPQPAACDRQPTKLQASFILADCGV